MTRDEAVAKMVRWDEDGYVDRLVMFCEMGRSSGQKRRLDPEAVGTLVPLGDETTRAGGCGRQRFSS